MTKEQKQAIEDQRALDTMERVTSAKKFAANIVASMVSSGKLDVGDTEQAIEEAKKWERYIWSEWEGEVKTPEKPSPIIS